MTRTRWVEHRQGVLLGVVVICALAVWQVPVARAAEEAAQAPEAGATPKTAAAPKAAPSEAAEPSQAPAEPTQSAKTPATQPANPTGKTPMAPSVQDNMDVQLEYTLTIDSKVVDSTNGRGPFHYVHGRGQLIPGLEHALTGMQGGESKDVTVSPQEGYGDVDPAAFVEVPKTQLPSDLTPTVGMVLQGKNPDGKSFRAKISEIRDKSVVLDLNHPLAGKTLNFQVKVTDIKPASPPAVPVSPPAVTQ